jgi:hypothetical protein
MMENLGRDDEDRMERYRYTRRASGRENQEI